VFVYVEMFNCKIYVDRGIVRICQPHHLTDQLEADQTLDVFRVEEALYVSLASPSDGIDSKSKASPLFSGLRARE